jgi:hypothetical protein
MVEPTLLSVLEDRLEEAAEPPPRWELAECTCPDLCERDHELD